MTYAATCSACGQRVAEPDAFCWNCGSELAAKVESVLAERRRQLSNSSLVDGQCRSCNGPLRNSDRFCVECGARRVGSSGAVANDDSFDQLRDRLVEVTQGDYEVLSELGRGGMGAVYLARDLHLGRPVAIKVLFPRFVTDAGMRDRFRNEARLVASLRHRSIVNLQAGPSREDLQFFVMDYIEGASLESVIRAKGPLPLPVVRSILYDVGSALAYAHAQGRGVVHRDIKPSNIMLEAEGVAVVTDFGISKTINRSHEFTQTGAIIGTPEYMSPEQCRGEPVTPAADQYALGILAYAMLTGTPPFSGPHMAVLLSQVSDEPPSLRRRRQECPPEVDDAVLRMLAKNPEDRWPNMRAAVKALGCQYLELGHPVRLQIGELAASAAGPGELARPVAEVSLSGTPRSVTLGDSFTLHAVALDEVGKELSGREVQWSSTDPSIVWVDNDGTSEARSQGRAWVRAECEGREATVEVVVAPAPVRTLVLAGAPEEPRAGDEFALRATPLDAAGAPLGDREVHWSTTDASVATVSRSGVVRAVAVGEVEIRAECEGVRASEGLNVLAASVAAMTIEGMPSGMFPGESRRLEAVVLDSRGRSLRDRSVEWRVSDEGVAAVSDHGVLRAVGPGRVRVSVHCEGVSASSELTVRPPRVVGLEVSSPPDLRPGERFEMTATPYDHQRSPLEGRDVSWSSEDRRVAFVSSGGVVEAVSPGDVGIRAECEGVSVETKLRVREAEVASIWVSRCPARIRPGDTFALDVAVLDERGQNLQGREVEWLARPEGRLDVRGGGRFEAIRAGKVRVIARCGQAERVTDLTILAPDAEEAGVRAPDLEPVATWVLGAGVGDHAEPIRDAARSAPPSEPEGSPVRPTEQHEAHAEEWSARLAGVPRALTVAGLSAAALLVVFVAGPLLVRGPPPNSGDATGALPHGLDLGPSELRVSVGGTVRPQPTDAEGRPVVSSQIDYRIFGDEGVLVEDGDGVFVAAAMGSALLVGTRADGERDSIVVMVDAGDRLTERGADRRTGGPTPGGGSDDGEDAGVDARAVRETEGASEEGDAASAAAVESGPGPITGIEIIGDDTPMRQDEERSFSVQAMRSEGRRASDPPGQVQWSAPENGPVRVQDGRASIIGPGTSGWIRARFDDHLDSVRLPIVPVAASVEVVDAPLEMAVGESRTVEVVTLDRFGQPMVAETGCSVAPTDIATVEEMEASCRVIAVAPGRAVLEVRGNTARADASLMVAVPVLSQEEARDVANRVRTALESRDRDTFNRWAGDAPDEPLRALADDINYVEEVGEVGSVELSAERDAGQLSFVIPVRRRQFAGVLREDQLHFEADIAAADGQWTIRRLRLVDGGSQVSRAGQPLPSRSAPARNGTLPADSDRQADAEDDVREAS